jgi:hypothetical protein
MSDYIRYIDFASIKLADLAVELGDYACALEFYNKAFDRLYQYQGDRMHPIMMAGSLKETIAETERKIKKGKSVLFSESWKLTKSSFVKGSQCIKSLYLDRHKPNEKNPISQETQEVFNQGHNFENHVRELAFPGGINVKDKVGNFKYFNSYTNVLLQDEKTKIIYEATIIEDSVLVMCDICVKREDGTIDFYEIKLNKTLNDAIKSDLAIQYTICKKRFGDRLNTFNLIMRVDNENKPYQIIDLTSELAMKTKEIEDKIHKFKSVLDAQEPTIAMSDHCLKPYECNFTNYCRALKDS